MFIAHLPILIMQAAGLVSLLHGVFRTSDSPLARGICFMAGAFMIFIGTL
jgi:hypothetical protein